MLDYLDTNFDYNSPELVEVFDELPLWSAPFGLRLLDKINYKKGIRAVDIGFGAGFPLTEIAMRLGSSSKIFGIDPWAPAIARTKKKLKRFGIEQVEIIEGTAENLGLTDNSIDLISSNNGLNNVENIERSLSECHRVMKQGGQIVQTMNLNRTMIEFYSVMEDVLRNQGLDEYIDVMHTQIAKKRKPLDDYLELMDKSGLKVNSVEHDSFAYQFADGSSLLNHYFMRMAFMNDWKGIVSQENQVPVFTEIESRLNAQAAKEGTLKLSVPFVVIDGYKK